MKKQKQLNQNKQGDKEKSSIRTYQGDLSKIIKNKEVSLAGAVIAEEKKQRTRFSKIGVETKKNIFLFAASAVLVVAGILSVCLLNTLKPSPIIKIKDAELKPIVYTEYQKELFFEKPSKLKLSATIQKEAENLNIPLGSLIYLYLTQRDIQGEEEMGKSLISVAQFMELIDARIPASLLRFIDPNFMFGFHSSTQNRPFLIMKTRSFENSFPEMLRWEENIIEDLRTVFAEDNPVLSKDRLREQGYQFKDVVIKNKDVRAVLDGGGKILFAYAFPDKETIVITTNKLTLQEIFDRLSISYHKR